MNEQVTNRLRAAIPNQLIKQVNGQDYISGHTAIDRLIQATGNDWSFRITNVIANPGHVAMQGELTIAGNTRSAWGEAKTTNNAKEELFKNAETDTLKRCARLFGVALELYGELLDEQTGEVTHRSSAPQRPQTRHRPDNRTLAHLADKVPPDLRAATQDAVTSAQAAVGRDFGHATPDEAKTIAKLMKILEWSRADVERFLDANYGVKRIADLGSRQDVSTFIDKLQAVRSQNEPAPVGGA